MACRNPGYPNEGLKDLECEGGVRESHCEDQEPGHAAENCISAAFAGNDSYLDSGSCQGWPNRAADLLVVRHLKIPAHSQQSEV